MRAKMEDYDRQELEIRCAECETPFTIVSSFNDEIEYCPFCGADIYLPEEDEKELNFEDD